MLALLAVAQHGKQVWAYVGNLQKGSRTIVMPPRDCGSLQRWNQLSVWFVLGQLSVWIVPPYCRITAQRLLGPGFTKFVGELRLLLVPLCPVESVYPHDVAFSVPFAHMPVQLTTATSSCQCYLENRDHCTPSVLSFNHTAMAAHDALVAKGGAFEWHH